ncbi:ribosomal RNA small subunit methyltransferase A [Amycolatopsis viridis]|uniref:23S rRNA (Adenine-N6)-dimethyltransferase n=1 Tax=Amycolatopsis viridis TaxID=185678 RepID=A0ABX0SPL4_9PSEU|nr:rRNA adenine N(6)-methyltransferase family protein [Amycolatopsis viridis]NIH78903.1 23S rRNA (adenine-N6)-dimethyltransferase [Amycolatopsis viridis]
MPSAPGAGRSAGVHFLATPAIAAHLVQSCAIGRDDLVLEIGAGQGALTRHLATTGARILAVERDDRFARRLTARFRDQPNVRVVHADARQIPLPRRRFLVVANIPYALSTTLLRRLLTPRTALHRAEMLVEWGFAKRICATVPRHAEQAWWAARFDLHLVSRVGAHHFSPPPRIDSAHLSIRRNHFPRSAEEALWTILSTAYRQPATPARTLFDRHALRRAGIRPSQPTATVPPHQWAQLARDLSPGRTWPALPRRLRT